MEHRAVYVRLTREAEVKLAESDLTSGQIPSPTLDSLTDRLRGGDDDPGRWEKTRRKIAGEAT
jgi:hypothetical protein